MGCHLAALASCCAMLSQQFWSWTVGMFEKLKWVSSPENNFNRFQSRVLVAAGQAGHLFVGNDTLFLNGISEFHWFSELSFFNIFPPGIGGGHIIVFIWLAQPVLSDMACCRGHFVAVSDQHLTWYIWYIVVLWSPMLSEAWASKVEHDHYHTLPTLLHLFFLTMSSPSLHRYANLETAGF